MKAIALTLLTLHVGYSSAANGVTFDWAEVGNPGNVADDTGFGAVDYAYRISKQEVTNAQYAEFLNAVAVMDSFGLYSSDMQDVTWGGITRSGTNGNYSYAVKAPAVGTAPAGVDYTYENKPVTFVGILNAMRFINWLENGQPQGNQGPSTTEDGVYTIQAGTEIVRSENTNWFLPNEDEWYKAAYHMNDGVTGNYWDYPTGSDIEPDNNLPSADTGNSANFDDRGLTTGSGFYPLTDVGAYQLSASPYGTFDQGGNASEHIEVVLPTNSYPIRGGSWEGDIFELRANDQMFGAREETGFRIGSRVPEPSALMLAMIASSAMLVRRRFAAKSVVS